MYTVNKHWCVCVSFDQSFHDDSPQTLYQCPLADAHIAGTDALMMGMSQKAEEDMDGQFADSIRQKLFRKRKGRQGMDLLALNIQRGRDHGIPGVCPNCVTSQTPSLHFNYSLIDYDQLHVCCPSLEMRQELVTMRVHA